MSGMVNYAYQSPIILNLLKSSGGSGRTTAELGNTIPTRNNWAVGHSKLLKVEFGQVTGVQSASPEYVPI